MDRDALARWMDGVGLESGPIEAPRQLEGGTQNVMLRFRRGARGIRAAPRAAQPGDGRQPHDAAGGAAAGGLAGTDVPHPRLVALCDDPGVLGGVFYLMEVVEGFNAITMMPQPHAGDPAIRHGMGLALVDGIARLAKVDHVAVGLGDFGRTDNFLERQAGRWRSQLEGYRQYAGWLGPQVLPGIEAVAAWLEAQSPPISPPA